MKDKCTYKGKIKCEIEFSNLCEMAYFEWSRFDDKKSIGSKYENSKKIIIKEAIRELISAHKKINDNASDILIDSEGNVIWKIILSEVLYIVFKFKKKYKKIFKKKLKIF